MRHKIAAVGMLAWCCLATGCWFNSPCCSPYDKAGPTYGDDPSIPNDFNYRKGSILGSETSGSGEYGDYIDDGAEYVPDNGAVSDYYEAQPQPVAQYTRQPQPVAQYRPQPQPVAQYSPQPQGATQLTSQPRRFPGLFRAAFPMKQGANYQGMRDQDGGYQGDAYQGAGYQPSGKQSASSYRTGMNPRYQSQRGNDAFDQDESEE